MRLKEADLKKTMEMELTLVKTERDSCKAKQRDADLKLKELERLKIALERKCDSEIEEFKARYERERDSDKRNFDAKRRQLEEDEHLFNLNKDRYLTNETERGRLEKENKQIKSE